MSSLQSKLLPAWRRTNPNPDSRRLRLSLSAWIRSGDQDEDLSGFTLVEKPDALFAEWKHILRAEAISTMEKAYAPYSDFKVGCAALVNGVRVVSGCNVENASYGVTLCAEAGMVSELIKSGGGRLTHFYCVRSDGEITVPCGRCRQLLSEHADRSMLIAMPGGETWTIDMLLPLRGEATDPKTGLRAKG